jgi:uncharacterized damage-inducible protein DinB
MLEATRWLERTFDFSLPLGMVPSVLERLRGTPARLEELTRDAEPPVLRRHDGQTWSALQNAGHLVQVEGLWSARLDDFEARREVLTGARFERGRVDQAGFDDQPLASLLAAFRAARAHLVARIEGLPEEQHEHRALHPRLQQSIRVLDLMVFAADHDDHHLARIGELLRGRSPSAWRMARPVTSWTSSKKV